MQEIRASTGRIVVLGRRDENLARCVTFDISEWQKLYGEGTVQLLAQRCQDTTPYPVAVTVKDGVARWEVKGADVAVPGEGRAELQYHVGDTLAKSDTYRTLVMPALGAVGPVPPDPEKDWVETVLQAARDAEQSAQDARDAVTQTITIGDNGNWFIEGEDTGVSASGSAPELGVDYWTEEDKATVVTDVITELDGGAGYTETDREGKETVHTIDPKFIPGAMVVYSETEPEKYDIWIKPVE